MKGHSALNSLQIRNLGVIESANIDFGDGLTVLTGETGAGKTMVLTALNLLLGGKIDANLIRNGSDRSLVSGEFRIPENLNSEIEELGAETETGNLTISRTILEGGKSKLNLGGVPMPAGKVSELGESLVEIHGQSTSARLMKSSIQRELLDSFCNHPELLKSYKDQFDLCQKLEQEILELKQSLKNRDKEISRLQEIVELQAKYKVKRDEFLEIDENLTKMGSGQAIAEALNSALAILTQEEDAPLTPLISAHKALKTIENLDKEIKQISDNLKDALSEINFSTSELLRYRDSLNADPAYFDQLQGRKSDLLSLLKKLSQNGEKNEILNEFVEQSALANQKIEQMSGGEEAVEKLEADFKVAFATLQKSAWKLSESRKEGALKLAQEVKGELTDLALASAELLIEVIQDDYADMKRFKPEGIDTVEFQFRSHPSSKFSPLSKGASGGELSRVMLALEVVIARLSPVGTYIFDEVDAGVGGKAAIEVGKKLAKIAKSSQVVVITHLAQVAVWADKHFVVEKSENGDITESSVFEVSEKRRETEIARLLSGQEESRSANEHAKELLDIVAQTMIS